MSIGNRQWLLKVLVEQHGGKARVSTRSQTKGNTKQHCKRTSPKLMLELSFTLLYANDVFVFHIHTDNVQHLLCVLETFHQISRLIADVNKTKMMVIQPRQYPTTPLLQTRESQQKWCKTLNILLFGVKVTSAKRWNGCSESRFQAGWNTYMFENQCNQSGT